MAKALGDVHNLIAATAEHYQYPPPSKLLITLQELLAHIVRMVLDFISSVLSVMPGYTDTRAVGNFMKVSLYAVGLLGAALLIWFIFSRLSELSKQAQLARSSVPSAEAPLTASAWHQQALTFAHAGRWKDACRAILLACVRLLDEEKVVPFMANRTNFEYGYALMSRQNLRANFKTLADIVDTCWFGSNQASQSDFRECEVYFDEIKAELASQVKLESDKEWTA